MKKAARLATAMLLAVGAHADNGSAPLPDGTVLRQRALEQMRKSANVLERYACKVRTYSDELNKDGSLKKRETKEVERFFINGVKIDHLLEKGGKPLQGGAAKKEQERVDDEVRKYSKNHEVEKFLEKREQQLDMFLRAQRFLHGRREVRAGRDTIVYDLEPDPKFKPKKLEERFARAVTGRIWLDEQSGGPVEVKLETKRDVKIGGGLIANLHKGFQFRLLRERQPEGVWISKVTEGVGDARAFFLHPRFRFKEEVERCRLFSVDSRDTKHDEKMP